MNVFELTFLTTFEAGFYSVLMNYPREDSQIPNSNEIPIFSMNLSDSWRSGILLKPLKYYTRNNLPVG